jgi:uncharacterized protein (TIGR00369 family)
MINMQKYLDDWLVGKVEPPITKLLGIHLLEYSGGMARADMTASGRHHNPMGVLHGGILCDLADAAMGAAIASALLEGETFSTVELHIHYFRVVREGRLTATGKVIRRGGSTAYIECEIVDGQNYLVAKAASTCLIQPAAGT